MNQLTLIGNLTAKPELRYINGQHVCTFTVAVNRPYKNKQTGERGVDFFRVVVWDKKAELCDQYLDKGRKVMVQGALETRSYDAEDGSKRYLAELKAREVEFLGSGQRYEDAPPPEPPPGDEDDGNPWPERGESA